MVVLTRRAVSRLQKGGEPYPPYVPPPKTTRAPKAPPKKAKKPSAKTTAPTIKKNKKKPVAKATKKKDVKTVAKKPAANKKVTKDKGESKAEPPVTPENLSIVTQVPLAPSTPSAASTRGSSRAKSSLPSSPVKGRGKKDT